MTGMEPLLNPPLRGWHGLSNEDCTTEWFLGWNMKLTTVPFGSMMLLGSKVSPFFPTSTVVCRTPPTGPVAGDWLPLTFPAASWYAVKVLPVSGLPKVSYGTRSRWSGHSRVDGMDHALLAVVGLTAVDPFRVLVSDSNGKTCPGRAIR